MSVKSEVQGISFSDNAVVNTFIPAAYHIVCWYGPEGAGSDRGCM